MLKVIHYTKMADNSPDTTVQNTTTPSNDSFKKCEWCKERECLPEMEHCNRLYCIAGMNYIASDSK